VSYRIDLTQPARYDRDGRLVNPGARRIVDLRFDGRPIDEAAEFVVVTNNYRASGGGNFPGLDGATVILQAPDETREAIVRYLSGVQTLNPSADANWSLVPVPGVRLRFVSGAGGIAHLAANPRIRLVRDNADGSALYEVVP
jgi:2',3'-cyclic-nucleotide 2'-phosphodiesterase/3'-nucleotidase